MYNGLYNKYGRRSINFDHPNLLVEGTIHEAAWLREFRGRAKSDPAFKQKIEAELKYTVAPLLGSEDKAFTVATGNDQNIMTLRWQNKNDGFVEDDKAATLKSSGTTTDERSVGAYIISGQSAAAKPITSPTPTLDTGGRT